MKVLIFQDCLAKEGIMDFTFLGLFVKLYLNNASRVIYWTDFSNNPKKMHVHAKYFRPNFITKDQWITASVHVHIVWGVSVSHNHAQGK